MMDRFIVVPFLGFVVVYYLWYTLRRRKVDVTLAQAREEFLATGPELPEGAAENLRAGRPWTGMPEDDLRRLFGEPSRTRPTAAEGRVILSFSRFFVYVESGVVAAWENR